MDTFDILNLSHCPLCQKETISNNCHPHFYSNNVFHKFTITTPQHYFHLYYFIASQSVSIWKVTNPPKGSAIFLFKQCTFFSSIQQISNYLSSFEESLLFL